MMTFTTHRIASYRIAAVSVAAMLVSILAARAGAAQGEDRRTIEGTWLVHVTALTACESGTPLGSFTSMLTFAKGGTLTGTTVNPTFAAGQRAPDHGVWSRGDRPSSYHASSLALLAFTTPPNPPASPGFQAGSQRIDQAIHLLDANHFTSDAITTFYAVDGTLYRRGCATAVAERFE